MKWRIRMTAIALGFAVVTPSIFAQQPPATRPDLGFVNLMPSGGHGNAGWSNISTVELYAKAVSRAATSSR